jgi:hypothetical protein
LIAADTAISGHKSSRSHRLGGPHLPGTELNFTTEFTDPAWAVPDAEWLARAMLENVKP